MAYKATADLEWLGLNSCRMNGEGEIVLHIMNQREKERTEGGVEGWIWIRGATRQRAREGFRREERRTIQAGREGVRAQ